MKEESLKVLVLGAHPDDAEFHAGGLIAIYRALGHTVKLVSVTDGGAGHHQLQPDELVPLRRQEAAAAGEVVGARYETWDNPDGRLEASLDLREQIIREIRRFQPDLLLTHRTCDYHPDHRAVGQAVQDASYMVTVPLVCPETPALRSDPLVMYMPDRFTRPAPLRADVVVDVGEQFETILKMMACHRSQFYQWLPYNEGIDDQVPADEEGKREFLRSWYGKHLRPAADIHRQRLIETYGSERGNAIKFAEAYEASEYAGQWNEETRRRLFPFVA